MINREEEHKKLCEYIHNMYKAKNADYGGSVTETYKKYGIVSFLVRMEDKLNRLSSITKNKKLNVTNESAVDTLLDLANYALLAAIELKNDELSNNITIGSIKSDSSIFWKPQTYITNPSQLDQSGQYEGAPIIKCENKE